MFVCCVKFHYTRAIYHADETRQALRGFKITKTEEYDLPSGCIFPLKGKKFRIGVLQPAKTIIFPHETDLMFIVYKSHL